MCECVFVWLNVLVMLAWLLVHYWTHTGENMGCVCVCVGVSGLGLITTMTTEWIVVKVGR